MGVNDDSNYDVPISGTLGALNSFLELDLIQKDSHLVTISGVWVGTISFQISADGTSWVTATTVSLNSGSIVPTTTANGTFVMVTSGCKIARVIMTAYTSGAASINSEGSEFSQYITALQGAPTSVANAWPIKVTDGVSVVTTDNNGNANNQRLHVAVPDTTIASGTFNALNTNISINMSGLSGCGFQINAGTLSATLTPYISMDGGTTWQATSFYDPIASAILNTITVTNPNSYKLYMVVTLGGTSHVKIQVTSYTSGSATALLRASLSANISITPSGAGGGSAAFGTIVNTTVTIPNNTATLIKTANTARKYLLISNPSGSLCYIGLGNTTGLTTSQGIPIPARTFWEIKGDNLFTGAVYAISGSSITFYLAEGTP